MLRFQNSENLIQFPSKIRVRLPEDVNRRWQSFAIFKDRQVPLIFLKLHTSTLPTCDTSVHAGKNCPQQRQELLLQAPEIAQCFFADAECAEKNDCAENSR